MANKTKGGVKVSIKSKKDRMEAISKEIEVLSDEVNVLASTKFEDTPFSIGDAFDLDGVSVTINDIEVGDDDELYIYVMRKLLSGKHKGLYEKLRVEYDVVVNALGL